MFHILPKYITKANVFQSVCLHQESKALKTSISDTINKKKEADLN